jgi:hypothetical protein
LINQLRYAHMVEAERLLVILEDSPGSIAIYMERGATLDAAIQNRRPKKTIHEDKIGNDHLFAYDERKRLLLVCASSKVHLFNSAKV